MNQAFTSSTFDWMRHTNDSSREFIGDHVAKWSSSAVLGSRTTLQNFLLTGIASSADTLSPDSLHLLRHFLNPLAWPLDHKQKLFDAGDLVQYSNMDMRHTIVAEIIEQAIHADVRPMLFQTDSQANYGLFAGASLSSLRSADTPLPAYVRLSPTLLTFPEEEPHPSVASEMYELAKRCRGSFQCLQLGVQEAINPKSAWIEASALGINALTLAACEADLLLMYIENFCKEIESVVLSVDLDVLSEPHAPGEHRSTSFGLNLEVLLPALRWIAGEGKLLGIEFTGLGLEQQHKNRRPRLAASLTQDLLSHWF